MRRSALLLLVALIAVSAAFIAVTAGQLPGLVASALRQWLRGQRLADPGQYLFWMLALAILSPLVIALASSLWSRALRRG